MRRRIGITTTRDRAGELAEVVLAGGCEPVTLPCIEVSSYPDDVLDRARDLAVSAARMLITSPRTVSTLWPEGGMPVVPVVAVGRRTADAVEAAGGNVSLVGEGGAETLLAQIPDGWFDDDMFFPHGAAADTEKVEDTGVVAMAVYETCPIPPDDLPVDAAIFGSPSAVAGWVSARSLEDIVIGAIGSTTADALTSQGFPPHVVPDRPGYEALIGLVATFLTDRSPV